jgi:hypothetical protein
VVTWLVTSLIVWIPQIRICGVQLRRRPIHRSFIVYRFHLHSFYYQPKGIIVKCGLCWNIVNSVFVENIVIKQNTTSATTTDLSKAHVLEGQGSGRSKSVLLLELDWLKMGWGICTQHHGGPRGSKSVEEERGRSTRGQAEQTTKWHLEQPTWHNHDLEGHQFTPSIPADGFSSATSPWQRSPWTCPSIGPWIEAEKPFTTRPPTLWTATLSRSITGLPLSMETPSTASTRCSIRPFDSLLWESPSIRSYNTVPRKRHLARWSDTYDRIPSWIYLGLQTWSNHYVGTFRFEINVRRQTVEIQRIVQGKHKSIAAPAGIVLCEHGSPLGEEDGHRAYVPDGWSARTLFFVSTTSQTDWLSPF